MNGNLGKQVRWLALNAFFAAMLYFGLVDGVGGAENVAIFIAWFTSLCGFAAASDVGVEAIRKGGQYIPQWIDVTFDVCVTATLVWFGFWVTGVAYLLHIFFLGSARARAFDTTKDESAQGGAQ